MHFNFVSRGACGQDSLRIFDGPTATSPTIGNICKRPSTSVVYSTGNQVRIHFTTSGKEKTASFEIQWSTVSPAALTTRLPVTTEQMATTKRDSRTSLPNVKGMLCDRRNSFRRHLSHRIRFVLMCIAGWIPIYEHL